MNNHESLFSFSDNLTTLVFIVASDLSEAQRETHTSSISLWGMNVPAYTFRICKNNVCGIVLYAEELDGKSFTPRERTCQQHEHIGKGRSKRTGRAFFGDEQTQDTEWRQEEDPEW